MLEKRKKKELRDAQTRLREEAVANLTACVQCAGPARTPEEERPATVPAVAWFYVPRAKKRFQGCCEEHAQKLRKLQGHTSPQFGVISYFEFPRRPTPDELMVAEVLGA